MSDDSIIDIIYQDIKERYPDIKEEIKETWKDKIKRKAPVPEEESKNKKPKEDEFELGNVQPWDCWTETFFCKICGKGPSSRSFEFTYWEHKNVPIYISEACTQCTIKLVKRDKSYTSKSFWSKDEKHIKVYNQFLDFGILEPEWLK